MEKFHEDFNLAKSKFKLVDHMINITYPLVRDTKLLLASVENIFLVFTSAMSALLHYERYYKKVPPFNPTFESKYFLYSNVLQDRHRLDEEYARIMRELKKTILEHKKSPVEFSKRDKYVICMDNYRTVVLTFPKIKEYLNKAKLFIQEINSIIYERQP